ncbi:MULTISPECIES: GTP cyclohydrolase II [Corallococcus]|nr:MULTISPECIES: GTP cyclohydrolase II [Corallococcus]
MMPSTAVPLLRHPTLLVLARAQLPTRAGTFTAVSFRHASGAQIEDIALIRGQLDGPAPVPTRLHSECLTGDALGSLRCDCRDQLEQSLEALAGVDNGVLLYLRQEGRGIGIANKLQAYQAQDRGLDTVQANLHLGFDDDLRTYDIAAGMLAALRIQRVSLYTNNPRKIAGLEAHGIEVDRRVALLGPTRPENVRYLETKRVKSGHLL